MPDDKVPLNIAADPDTIWSIVSEHDFRNHVVRLEENTNAIPIDVMRFEDKVIATTNHGLPLQVEKQLTNDLAFIAAVGQGAQSVSAVCIEQDLSKSSINIRFAAADAINDNVRELLQGVCHEIVRVHELDGNERDLASEKIFTAIVQVHQKRLLGRIRSRKWMKPKYLAASHKKCLWQDFEQLAHRAQHVYPSKKQRTIREKTLKLIGVLGERFEAFEESELDLTSALQQLIKESFAFCMHEDIRQFAASLEMLRPTAQISAALKTLHQLEKVGSYWRVAQDVISMAECHAQQFTTFRCEFLKPYDSIPTTIGYETWAESCHVHAEVQLIVDCDVRNHDQAATVIKPRVIGTSKYLCYLCHLFVLYHNTYQVQGTHGRIYDQWTVPDLQQFSSDLKKKYAYILSQMDNHIQEASLLPPMWRPEPMTSRQDLLMYAPNNPNPSSECSQSFAYA